MLALDIMTPRHEHRCAPKRRSVKTMARRESMQYDVEFLIATSPARNFRMRGRDGVCTPTLHDGSSQAISLPVNSHVII